MQKLLLMQGELQGNNCAAEHDRMSLILGISLTSTEGCSKLHDYHHLPIFAASLQVLSVARATRLCCQSNNANKGRQVAPQVGSLQSSFVEKTYCSILVQICKPNQELIKHYKTYIVISGYFSPTLGIRHNISILTIVIRQF